MCIEVHKGIKIFVEPIGVEPGGGDLGGAMCKKLKFSKYSHVAYQIKYHEQEITVQQKICPRVASGRVRGYLKGWEGPTFHGPAISTCIFKAIWPILMKLCTVV